MLSTNQARIHTGCQFHRKNGDFLLFSAGDTALGVLITLTSLSGGDDNQMEIMAEHLDDPMWNLVVCNSPAEHNT